MQGITPVAAAAADERTLAECTAAPQHSRRHALHLHETCQDNCCICLQSVCNPVQGIRTVAAAAMGCQMPTESSAARQLAEVMAELQSLPQNGQVRATVGSTGPKSLHRSSAGSAVQSQPLQVSMASSKACVSVSICESTLIARDRTRQDVEL